MFVGLLLFFLDIPVDMRFALAAVLYGLFAIPIFLVVKEPRDPDAPPITVGDFLASWAQLRLTIAHARQVPGLSRFLLGRFFYSDAVNTVIVVMSVVAVKAVGLHRADDGADPAAADRRRDPHVVRVGLRCPTGSGRGSR